MSRIAAKTGCQISLPGINGGNLLGFLAALGTLRALTAAIPDASLRMGWKIIGTAWRPVLDSRIGLSDLVILEWLTNYFEKWRKAPESHPVMLWQHWLGEAAGIKPVFAAEVAQCTVTDRDRGDWLAGIGTEAEVAKGQDGDSAFRAARTDYIIGNLRAIISRTESGHLNKVLFGPWVYDDPMDNLSLKFDSSEDRRHAYQWSAPSGDPDRKKRGNVLGANRLAIEAIPLFPTVVDGQHLATTGFTGTRSTRNLTWCLWDEPVGVEVVRSILALQGLTLEKPDTVKLKRMGIPVVYRCQRQTIGKTRIFTPPFAL